MEQWEEKKSDECDSDSDRSTPVDLLDISTSAAASDHVTRLYVALFTDMVPETWYFFPSMFFFKLSKAGNPLDI